MAHLVVRCFWVSLISICILSQQSVTRLRGNFPLKFLSVEEIHFANIGKGGSIKGRRPQTGAQELITLEHTLHVSSQRVTWSLHPGCCMRNRAGHVPTLLPSLLLCNNRNQNWLGQLPGEAGICHTLFILIDCL